jgi:hypothetical protein
MKSGDTVPDRSSQAGSSQTPQPSVYIPTADLDAAAIAPVRAELIGANRATAHNVVVTSVTPILDLCRALVAGGVDRATPLHAYRGNTLALKVRSICEGAKLTVEANPIGKPVFRRRRDRAESNGAAPPVAPTAPDRHPVPPRCA